MYLAPKLAKSIPKMHHTLVEIPGLVEREEETLLDWEVVEDPTASTLVMTFIK